MHRRSRHAGNPALLPRGYRPDIEGLRAVAVLLVVAYHAGLGLFGGGYVGVDVFFVLSGFLITGLLVDELSRTGRISFTAFYARRIRRLLPASTLTLVVTTLVFALTLSPLDRPSMASDVRAAALYVANWHFAFGALSYLNGDRTSPVLHYWSLAVEEQFYLVWPLLLVGVAGWAARRGRIGDLRRLTAFGLVMVLAASLTLSAEITPRAAPFAYYGLHTRAWELAAGGLLAIAPAWVAHAPRTVRVIGAWLGIALIVVSAVAYDDRTAFPGLAATVPVVGTMLVVAAGAGGQRSGVPLLLSLPPLRYIGRTSYSWYLWHWPVLVFVGIHTGGAAGVDNGGAAALRRGPALLAVVVSFGIAALTHHLFEDPLRRSRWLAAVRARSLSLGAAATATAVLASVVVVAAAGGSDSPVTTTVVTQAEPALTAPAAATSTPTSSPVAVTRHVVRLRMTPSFARVDRPHGDERCYDGYTTAAAPAPQQCLFGDPNGNRTIVLLGDSHAQQWFTALDTQARARHWRLFVWVKSECPFTDIDMWLPEFHGRYPTCRPWRDSVLHNLDAIGRIDAVLLGHTSTYHVHLLAPNGSKATKTGDVLSLWSSGFARMSKRLRTVARHVLVLRDPPRPRVDVPSCLAAHPRNAVACAVPHNLAFTWADRLLAAEHQGGLGAGDVLDLVPQMCPGTICPVVSTSGLIMYRDSNHLTTSYTMTLATRLGAAVAARIG